MSRTHFFQSIAVAAALLAVPSVRPAAAQSAAAAAQTALPSVALPPVLDRVLRDYEKQWGARSPAGLAALFTDDGFVLQNGRPPARGRAAIEQAYAGQGGPLSLRALSFATADTVGYIVGAYTSSAGSPDVGKFILLVRRARGGPWRIAADMDNAISRRP